MASSIKFESKIQGETKFRAWKTRMNLILARNKVLELVQGKVREPTNDVGKEKYK